MQMQMQMQMHVLQMKILDTQFRYGPRSCIGKRLAEMEMHLILARIVQKFELRHVASLPEVTPVMRTLLTPPIDKIIPVEFIRK